MLLNSLVVGMAVLFFPILENHGGLFEMVFGCWLLLNGVQPEASLRQPVMPR